jgi:thymidylate synthase ThyX
MPENPIRRIYLLQAGEFSPETIAVAFAKTSRSPHSFDEIAAELSDADSARFHEKWVVGYGHASVAEHAVLHIAFENISRLAIECLESNRLASYTEKSTRYQRWKKNAYHIPDELCGSGQQDSFRRACDQLFESYRHSLEAVSRVVLAGHPRREGESAEQHDARLRSRYVDACRFLLPAASLANVGMTANARALAHAIRKMLSHPLQEVREIGEQVKGVAQEEVPTLVRYAEAVPYQQDMSEALAGRAVEVPQGEDDEWLRLVKYSSQGEEMVLAAALFGQGAGSFQAALDHVAALDEEGRRDLAGELLRQRGEHDVPPRALEHASYTFEVLLDQGAYAELKRHRMMTQTPQRLTAARGYAIPRLISEAGFEARYRAAMDEAADCYQTLAQWNPHAASYVVANGFKRRVVLTLNLREAFHFCELRAGPNAHFSMRRIALRMAELIRGVHPVLAAFMRLPQDDWRQIEAENFAQA